MAKRLSSLVFLLALCLFSVAVLGQTGSLQPKEISNLEEKGAKYVADSKYKEAVKVYLQLWDNDPENFAYNYTLADLFINDLGRFDGALPYLNKAKAAPESAANPELIFLESEYLFQRDEPKQALQGFMKYQEAAKAKPNPEMEQKVERRIKECNLAIEHRVRHLSTRVVNVGDAVNSEFPDYIPVVDKNERLMFYTSRRNENTYDKKDKEDQQFYEDMFVTQRVKGVFAKGKLVNESNLIFRNLKNVEDHDSPVFLSYDEKYLISYRGGYKENKLWISEIINDTIQPAEILPKAINRSDYQPHASMTQDNKVMYFTSEDESKVKQGTNRNIYRAEKDENGKWANVTLLSNVINTLYDEDSPVISGDGKTLYFSSKGHNSMGGYDVFKSMFVDGAWTKPVNMGEPINSGAHDIYFKPTYDGKSAYLSSNRLGGLGDMDIYRVELYDNLFVECEPMRKQLFPVDLRGGEGYEGYDEDIKYEWETGDGNRVSGENVTYNYKKPGNYLARLIAIFPNGTKKYTPISLEVVIGSQVTYLALEVPDTTRVEKEVHIDASGSQAENGNVMDYFWRVDNNFLTGSSSIDYKFTEPGEHWISLEVLVSEEGSLQRETVCVSKKVTVLSKDDWIAFARIRTRDDVEKRLLAANEEIVPLDIQEVGAIASVPQVDQQIKERKMEEPPRIEIGVTEEDLLALEEQKKEAAAQEEELAMLELKAGGEEIADGAQDLASTQTGAGKTSEEAVEDQVVAMNDEPTATEDSATPVSVDPINGMEVVKDRPAKADEAVAGTTPTKKDPVTKPKTTEPKPKTEDPKSKLDPELLAGLDVKDVPDFELENIPFAFDKSRLGRVGYARMVENLQKLKDHPDAVIKITAHTDSRGSNDYNVGLSERRARTVAEFFIKNGIAKNRILAVVNVGETQLLNDCGDDEDCPEQLHKLNRRAEIQVVARRIVDQ